MRRNIFLLFVLLVLTLSCSRKMDHFIPLDHWQFEYNGQWYDATTPGCIHTDLLANGLIPDPFYGTNEDSVQWVSQRDWHYRTTFPKSLIPQGFSFCILFHGLQTYADVILNGDTMHSHNMFKCFDMNYRNGDQLCDNNLLEVIFHPTAPRDSAALAALGYDLPDHRVFSRTAPYQQGWDWGPKLNTCGIWQPVEIIIGDQINVIGRSVSEECVNRGVIKVKKNTWFDNHKITFEAKPDSIGLAYTFYDNGEPIFCKGANWIPCHSFPSPTPALKEQYRYLLCSAKEANFNMLRVWGGGIYENDYFFDLCDSLGIMVWMDFNFSCALYPSDEVFLEELYWEAMTQVARIAKHPCVVLWCGNNEVKNGWEDWGWQQQYGWTPQQMAELQHGIDTIFGPKGILETAVRELDPLKRPYISTSPLYGWGHPECVTHGDSHYWGVWWGELPFEVYREKTGRFMSEYGFQSYPDYSTVCRFCPEDQRTIDSPTMRSHQKHGRGREIIDKAMLQYYGVDSRSLSLEDYCYVSQLLQAWGTGYGILQHLLAKPHCMGTLYWQLDDCWPVASWSSIDCYGNWKALHYRAQALYAENADLAQWIRYYAVYPKDLSLHKAAYKITRRHAPHHLSVTLTAHTDLRDVMLQTQPHVDGHFDINYFDLAEGRTATAIFIPKDPATNLDSVAVTVKTWNDLLLAHKGEKHGKNN